MPLWAMWFTWVRVAKALHQVQKPSLQAQDLGQGRTCSLPSSPADSVSVDFSICYNALVTPYQYLRCFGGTLMNVASGRNLRVPCLFSGCLCGHMPSLWPVMWHPVLSFCGYFTVERRVPKCHPGCQVPGGCEAPSRESGPGSAAAHKLQVKEPIALVPREVFMQVHLEQGW